MLRVSGAAERQEDTEDGAVIRSLGARCWVFPCATAASLPGCFSPGITLPYQQQIHSDGAGYHSFDSVLSEISLHPLG